MTGGRSRGGLDLGVYYAPSNPPRTLVDAHQRVSELYREIDALKKRQNQASLQSNKARWDELELEVQALTVELDALKLENNIP